MKKNRMWIVLIPVVLVAVALIGVAGFLMVQNDKTDEYAQYIHLAQERIEAQDYAGAIAAYEEAISLDTARSTAYEGMMRIYIATGEIEKLETILNRYEEATSDVSLRNRYAEDIQRIMEEASAEQERWEEAQDEMITSMDGKTAEASAPTEEVALDGNLLSFLAGATYSDYTKLYGEAVMETSGSTSVLQYQLAPIVCTYSAENGEVTVDSSGKPFSGSRPTSISVTDLSILLRGMTGETTLEVLRSDSALHGAAVTASDGSYFVTFESNGCSVVILADENGTISGPDAWNEIRVCEVVEDADTCTLAGSVIDATTGAGVMDARLAFRAGAGNESGSVLQEVASDGYGSYSLDLEPGEYTVEISAPGYITEYFAVEIYSWFTTNELDFVISPELIGNEIRIVLEWGSFPNDLDAYLFGTSSTGAAVRVCYENMIMDGVASLDTDSRTGYGPETITVYDMEGDFQVVVADYYMTGTMAESGATVKVYMPGSDQPTVIPITSSAEDDWFVCSINQGVLTVENRPYNGQRTPGNK